MITSTIDKFLISAAQAQTATPTTTESLFSFLAPLAIIFIIFWFFLIRPQQKRQKAFRALIGSIQKNDQVVTNGGIYGKVTKVLDQHSIMIEISKGVEIKVQKSLINNVINKNPAAQASNTSQANTQAASKSSSSRRKSPAKPKGKKK